MLVAERAPGEKDVLQHGVPLLPGVGLGGRALVRSEAGAWGRGRDSRCGCGGFGGIEGDTLGKQPEDEGGPVPLVGTEEALEVRPIEVPVPGRGDGERLTRSSPVNTSGFRGTRIYHLVAGGGLLVGCLKRGRAKPDDEERTVPDRYRGSVPGDNL